MDKKSDRVKADARTPDAPKKRDAAKKPDGGFWRGAGAAVWGKRSALERALTVTALALAIVSAVFIGLYFALMRTPDFMKPVQKTDTDADDDYFFNFRQENFAPSTEPLINKTFGNALIFDEASFWQYPSYNSFCAGFSLNLPALALLEYGETVNLGKRTAQSDGYYYNHTLYITGLSEGKKYYFRLAAKGYDGATVTSKIYSFRTRRTAADGVIKIPDDLQGTHFTEEDGTVREGPPYYLTAEGAKYVLTRDLTVPQGAVIIKAHNVTLDLNGFTISYDNAAPEVDVIYYNERTPYGIRTGLWNYSGEKIYNGRVVQGSQNTVGAVPVHLYHDSPGGDAEVAGVTVVWRSDDTHGITSGHADVRHCVVHDKGSVITNRHDGVRAVHGDGGGRVVYNSFRRFRHVGVRGDFDEVSYNEMYSDSFATNSFALSASNGQVMRGNKIFGTGYLPIGIGWAKDIDVRDNFIYMLGTAPSRRSSEYGRDSGIAGIRYTVYNEGDEAPRAYFKNNIVVLKAYDDCAYARGLWLGNSPKSPGWLFESNTVKVERVQPVTTSGVYVTYTCVDMGGDRPDWGDGVAEPLNPLIFRNNTLIGNEMLVTLGSDYGGGGAAWFYNTVMIKSEIFADNFLPIRAGWWYFNTMNNRFIDTVYQNFEYDENAPPRFFGRSTAANEEDGENLVTEELRFGFSRSVRFTDSYGVPLENVSVTIEIENDYRPEKFVTDADGNAMFDVLTVRHMKHFEGRDLPNATSDGDVITTTPLTLYTFFAPGYKSKAVSVADLSSTTYIILEAE
ncbi:MAG: hypothetical protein LBP26_04985 [Clostridiales bacterium]|jgi:hypothetical protein|nr:hypothetical protein [Clostridiales bacterium]